MRHILLNALMFNASWIAIVSMHSYPLAVLVITTLHLLLHYYCLGSGREVLYIIAVSGCGLLFDQCLFRSGVLVLDSGIGGPPLWMACLWPVFATTLHHVFAPLGRRLRLAAIVGAAGGAGSYLAGAELTDVSFNAMPSGPLTIAFCWALLFPALLRLARLFQPCPTMNLPLK